MTTPNRYLVLDIDTDRNDCTKVIGIYAVIYDGRFEEVSRLSCDATEGALPGLVRWLERHDLPVLIGDLRMAAEVDQILWDAVGASFFDLIDDSVLDVLLLGDLLSSNFEPYPSGVASFGRCSHTAQFAAEVLRRTLARGYN